MRLILRAIAHPKVQKARAWGRPPSLPRSCADVTTFPFFLALVGTKKTTRKCDFISRFGADAKVHGQPTPQDCELPDPVEPQPVQWATGSGKHKRGDSGDDDSSSDKAEDEDDDDGDLD